MPTRLLFDGRTPWAATRLGAGVRRLAWIAAAVLLLLPAVAMQFGTAVDWGTEDFLFAALMLAGACAALELLLRRPADPWYAAAFLLALAIGFVLLWANLAVGLIGGEQHPANALYLGVIGVGLGGVLLARLRPRPMAWAMVATAAAQGAVVLAALAWWPLDVRPVLAANAGFIVGWMACGAGFARAARSRPGAPMP